jgi:hypothetical protein
MVVFGIALLFVLFLLLVLLAVLSPIWIMLWFVLLIVGLRFGAVPLLHRGFGIDVPTPPIAAFTRYEAWRGSARATFQYEQGGFSGPMFLSAVLLAGPNFTWFLRGTLGYTVFYAVLVASGLLFVGLVIRLAQRRPDYDRRTVAAYTVGTLVLVFSVVLFVNAAWNGSIPQRSSTPVQFVRVSGFALLSVPLATVAGAYLARQQRCSARLVTAVGLGTAIVGFSQKLWSGLGGQATDYHGPLLSLSVHGFEIGSVLYVAGCCWFAAAAGVLLTPADRENTDSTRRAGSAGTTEG